LASHSRGRVRSVHTATRASLTLYPTSHLHSILHRSSHRTSVSTVSTHTTPRRTSSPTARSTPVTLTRMHLLRSRPRVLPRTGHSPRRWQWGRCRRPLSRTVWPSSGERPRPRDRRGRQEATRAGRKTRTRRRKASSRTGGRRTASSSENCAVRHAPTPRTFDRNGYQLDLLHSQPELMPMLAFSATCQSHRRAGDEHHLVAERARFVAVGLFRLAKTRVPPQVSDPGPRIGALQ
jgi:hypothetical protein